MVLVTLLTIDQDARQVIDVIVGVLQASPPEEQKVLATLLPSWLKRDDSILAFIPGPEQVSILLERRQQGPSWDEAITQILHVLSAADLPRRVRIVDLLPEDIHRDPRFISYLSPSQRVTALAAMCHDDCVPDATLVEQVSAALAQCQPDQRRTLVTALPPLFRQHDGFIEYLEPAERISELVARFNAGTLDEHSATKRIETALQELPESRRPRAVTALPEAIGIQDCLLLFRTPEEQIRVFATRLSDHADERNDDVVASVISRLAMIKPGFRLPAVEFLPTWLKQDHRVLLSLPAPDQLQVLSAFIPNDPVTATALYVAEVASALSVITSGCRNEYLGPFPVWLRLLEPVYRLIPLAQRFTLLLTELRKEGPPGDPTLIDRLGDVLRKAPREDIQSLALEQLPSWIQDDERIFLCLSARDQMRVLLSCLPEVPAPATAPYVERIARALGAIDADTRASFIGCLPSWLLWLGPVYPLVPFDLRFPILLVKLMQEGSTDDPTVLARTVEHLGDLPSDEFANRLRLLPPWALVTVEILRLGQNLSAAEQVEIWWLALTNDLPTVWPFLSRVSKIMALYRAAKERRTWTASSFSGDQATFKEDDLITWCALTIFLSSSLSDGGKVNVFHDVHFALLEHVKTSYGDTTAPIDLSPLLPGCAPKKVPNCEGRHWKRDAAYCPRLQSPCLLFHGVVDESRLDTLKSRWGQQNGARIVADDRLPWQDWSLQELMAASGIEAHLPGLESHDDYVPRLSGWVNRVNEVRSRLSCSHCQAVLLPNMKYARNYAAYNTTVFYCQLGHESVYLNHCWCCGRIIDSRECQIEIEGYRLCLQCGSGPKNSDFAAGDLCPKCGESEMQRLHDGNRRICSFCSHRIRVVAPNPSDYFAGF